ALYMPNDPGFPSQWGPQKVGAQAACDVTRGSPNVRVAVVDCGIFGQATGRLASDGQAGHPNLRGRGALNQDFSGAHRSSFWNYTLNVDVAAPGSDIPS